MMLIGQVAFGQNQDSLLAKAQVYEVNELYEAGKYQLALEKYRQVKPLILKTSSPTKPALGNYYRSLSHILHGLEENDSSIYYLRLSWQEFQRVYGKDNKYTIDVEYEIGYLFHHLLDFDSALHYYNGALANYRKYIGDHTDDVPLALHQIGTIYKDLSMFDQALIYHQQAFDLWNCLGGPVSDRMLTSYFALGNVYEEMGKLDQANVYYKKANEITQELYPNDPSRLLKSYNRLARINEVKGDQKLWKKWLEKCDESANALPKENHYSYGQWGRYYRMIGAFDNAIEHFRLASKIQEQLVGTSPVSYVYLADSYVNLGQTFKESGEFDSATFYFDKAHFLYEKHYPLRLYYTLFEKTDLAFETGDVDAGLEFSHAFLAYFTESSEKLTLDELLQKDIQIYPDANSIKVMLLLADRFWQLYEQEKKTAYLNYALAAFEQLDRWYDPLHRTELQINARMANFRGWIYKGLLRGHVASYEQNGNQESFEKAFRTAELSKSFSLVRHLRQASLIKYESIPDSLILKEATLRAEITLLASMNNGNAATLNEREEKLLGLYENYDALTKKIEEGYPHYFSLLHQEPIQVADLEGMLSNQQGLIMFSRVDSVLYTFVFGKNVSEILTQKLPEKFVEQVQSFRSHLADYDAYTYDPEIAFGQFCKESKNLYDLLLAAPISHFPADLQELILIPEEELTHIPFEVLITNIPTSKENDFAAISFLLQDYQISYNYSASLFKEQKIIKKGNKAPQTLASFAPSYSQPLLADNSTRKTNSSPVLREEWQELDGAAEEALEIAELFQGDFYQGNAASKQAFLDRADEYKVLHLAMHSSILPASPLQSSLVFSPNIQDSVEHRLYASDLFNLKLDAELVVLSACHSGFESTDEMLGNYSLTKAFQYAGTTSLAMSLWKVSDKSTQKIMVRFYQYLKEGKNKAEALRQAKIDYLAQCKAAELTHPFFWAGFILTGNREPLNSNANFPFWILGIVLGVGVIGMGIWQFRKI